jgi:hypothetical protein
VLLSFDVPDRWFSSISVAVAVVPPTVTMQNEEGKMVDLYVPRKWYVCFIIVYLEIYLLCMVGFVVC